MDTRINTTETNLFRNGSVVVNETRLNPAGEKVSYMSPFEQAKRRNAELAQKLMEQQEECIRLSTLNQKSEEEKKRMFSDYVRMREQNEVLQNQSEMLKACKDSLARSTEVTAMAYDQLQRMKKHMEMGYLQDLITIHNDLTTDYRKKKMFWEKECAKEENDDSLDPIFEEKKRVLDLLETYADSLESTLEKYDVVVLRATPGVPRDPETMVPLSTVNATEEKEHDFVADVRGNGYRWDREDGKSIMLKKIPVIVSVYNKEEM